MQSILYVSCDAAFVVESEVGAGIRAMIDEKVLAREELFVTTKLWNTMHHEAEVLYH